MDEWERPQGAVPPYGGGDWFARFLTPAEDTKGWLKFMGIVSIVSGALMAFTVIGILWAWLYVWLGVLLWQAGDRAGQAVARRDAAMFEQYLLKLKTVIMIAGVVVAIGVLLTALGLVMLLTVGWLGLMEALEGLYPI